jgi:hypothetical protein
VKARPRNRWVTLSFFLAGVIFAGFAVQRALEIKLSRGLEEPAFPETGDPEAALKRAFNEGPDETRIVVILRVGSLSSEQDVEAVRKLLREERRAKVRILAVWRGPMPLREHTTRFGDGRVRHVWDPESVLLTGRLEGTVLSYRAGVAWADEMPPPQEEGEPARAVLPLLRRAFGGL